MRNLFKLLVIVGVLFISLTSCEKDIVIVDAFDFEIEANYQEITTINFLQRTRLSILQEKPLERDNFFFSYKLLEGQGAFIIDGSPVSQNEFIEIENPELEFDIDFVSNSVGIKKVQVEINNNGKVIEVIDLIYDVRHNPFSLTMTSPIVDYTENEVIDIKVSLQNVGVDKSLTYKRAFFLLEGEGELFINGVSDAIALEEFLPIDEGETGYSLIMSTFGIAKFLVRTIDSNGQIKEDILEFNGFSSTLRFNVETNSSSLFVNANFTFDFQIPPFPGASGTKMSYSVNGGSLDISSNGEEIDPNTEVDVPDSGSFSWTVLSTTIQEIQITFTLERDGQRVSQVLTLLFQEGSFSLTVKPQSIDGNVDEGIRVDGSIIESGSSSGPYKVEVTTDKSGVITYNGTDYSSGETFSIGNNLNFVLFYKGLEIGTHALDFTAFDINDVPSNTVEFNTNFQN